MARASKRKTPTSTAEDSALMGDTGDKATKAATADLGDKVAGENETDTGDKAGETTGDVSPGSKMLPPAEHGHARESRAQASNRWTREGRRAEVELRRIALIKQYRAEGLTRKAAVERAWDIAMAEYPPPGVEPAPAAAEQPIAAYAAPEGVTGLGDLPAEWPDLPPNAPLRSEVEWVSANRLLVADGHTVILSRALSPPPSHAALSWLETSILYPAKFADIAVRSAQHDSEDEREITRRERLAIDEVRQLLAEMLADRGPILD